MRINKFFKTIPSNMIRGRTGVIKDSIYLSYVSRLISTHPIKGPGDYLGIKSFNKDDIFGMEVLDESKKTKLQECLKGMRKPLDKLDKEGETHKTSYGAVRYDIDNPVEYMGQFDDNNTRISQRRKFLFLQNKLALQRVQENVGASELSSDVQRDEEKTLKVVEEFKREPISREESTKLDVNNLESFKSYVCPQNSDRSQNKIKFAFSDEWKVFQRGVTSEPTDYYHENLPEESPTILEKISFAADSPLRSIDEVASELKLNFTVQAKEDDTLKKTKEEIFDTNPQTEEAELNNDPKENIPKTALDYIIKIREGELAPTNKKYTDWVERKTEKAGAKVNFKKFARLGLDSKGFRVYTHSVENLYHFTRAELLLDLKKKILFNDRDIIAISKPYGMIVAGATGKNQDHINLESLLPDLSTLICPKGEKLHLVHRLDRDTTGVLLLAKTTEMALTLRDMFKEKKVMKYYWALVRAAVKPQIGIIDIPLEFLEVQGRERMVLRPYCDEDYNRTTNRTSKPLLAITHYRVLREAGNASVVEVRPEQGVKHQIRAHLGLGLRAPILGDNKYSYVDKIAPQKLPQDMLEKLHVRQQKVRTIPMHLHAKLIILPEIGRNGKNIFIPAVLPPFFLQNMTRLGLSSQMSVVKKPSVDIE